MSKKTHDVFLCHNSEDKPFVRDVAAAVKSHGLTVWFDEEDMVGGQPWQEQLEAGLGASRTVAVFVGKEGVKRWATNEMRVALDDLAQGRVKAVIPVLIPGAPKAVKLPPFLKQLHWINLREGLSPEGLERLVAAIQLRKVAKDFDPFLAAYRAWAMDRYRGLTLIGLGAAARLRSLGT